MKPHIPWTMLHTHVFSHHIKVINSQILYFYWDLFSEFQAPGSKGPASTISSECSPSISNSLCLKLAPPSPKPLLYCVFSVLLKGTVHLVIHLVSQFINWQCLKFPFKTPTPLISTTVQFQVSCVSCLDCRSKFLTVCFNSGLKFSSPPFTCLPKISL